MGKNDKICLNNYHRWEFFLYFEKFCRWFLLEMFLNKKWYFYLFYCANLVSAEIHFFELKLERLTTNEIAGFFNHIPAGNYMFQVNNRNTRLRCEICSKLTIKIPERRYTGWDISPDGVTVLHVFFACRQTTRKGKKISQIFHRVWCTEASQEF